MSRIFIAFMPTDIFYFAASEGDIFSTSCKIHESFPLFLFVSFKSHPIYHTQLSHMQTNLILALKNQVSAAYLAFPAYISQSFLCMSPWKVNPSLSSPDGTWYTWKGRNQQGSIITSPFTIIYYFSYLDING